MPTVTSKSMAKKRKRWSKREKVLVKTKEETFNDRRPTDIIIPVMGKTGAGKSTFINTLLGKDVMKVGHDMESCTGHPQHEILDSELVRKICPGMESRRVILVDTPGFNDTYLENSEILRRITVWLAPNFYAGIIYLQNIADRKMECPPANHRNFEMFKKLCGTNALNRVILGTTGWQEVQPEVAQSREEQLKKVFWKEMMDSGSTVKRFYHDEHSAIDIVRCILEQIDPDQAIMQIRQELVDMKRFIPQTDPGQKYIYSMERLLETHPHGEEEKGEFLQKVLHLWTNLKYFLGL